VPVLFNVIGKLVIKIWCEKLLNREF